MPTIPTTAEILSEYNKSQDINSVAKKFNWAPGYAKFMVDNALKQGNMTASGSQNPSTAVIEEEVIPATATMLNEELEKVEVPIKEVSINKDEQVPLAMLRIKLNAEDFVPEILSAYIRRDTDNLVETFAKLKRNICLIGDSGTGKTTMVEQYAALNQLPFLRISCDETSSLKTLLGTKEIINGTTYFRAGVLLELIQIASVILFDEFNALHSSKLFFLHELLDNRRIFVQDADGGKVIKIHPKCQIFLACNPANKNYGGTNKMNAALGNRTTVIDVPTIKIEEMEKLFECGKHTSSMKQFYSEAQRAIYDRNLRVAFSLRNIQRATEAIKTGMKPLQALRYEFYNAALLTASEVERDVFEGIGLRIFGR
jgi:nitric oxide reductase NorQ protein